MNRLQSILPGAFLVAALLASSISASAQASAASGADGAAARIHWGPLALDPKLLINNVGVDSNVFNAATAPEKDFNISAGPEVGEWLRVGRFYFSGTTNVGLTYYKKAKSQRSTDFGQKGRVEARLVRFTPHFAAGYLNTHQRLNAEFDARVPRATTDVAAGVLLPLGVRTSLDLEAVRSRVALDDDNEDSDSATLAQLFNRESRGVTARFSLAHSPLTTFVVRADLRQDRFDNAAERDSNSVSLIPGVEFARDALLSGSAYVGFRTFMTRAIAVPNYTGPVANVNLRVSPRERLSVSFRVNRDVDYSIDPLTPYFVSTGGDFTVSQGIGGGWDLVGRAGMTRLGYRGLQNIEDNADLGLNRADTLSVIGTGIGRTLVNGLRLGFDFDHARRSSDLDRREYSGFRAGGSVSYGF